MYERNLTISWLESNRNNGFFVGHPEDTMDFKTLSDEDLLWYYEEWVTPDTEDDGE